MRTYRLSELAALIDAEVVGDPDYSICTLATLHSAQKHELSFVASTAYRKYLATTQAGALIVNPALSDDFVGNKLVVANPYMAYATLSAVFDKQRPPQRAIHPTAVIPESCRIGSRVSIAPNVTLGEGVVIEDDVTIGAGCFVGDDSVIAQGTMLMPNVTIYHGITVGEQCRIHSGAVIGADGFGFAPYDGRWKKIHQLGGVTIGNRVEIGASTCIDRGALDDTRIADDVIIDNLVQIAHNVVIGKGTAIAAKTGIAGSTTIGEYCTLAGAVGVAGHLTITDRVHVSAMSLVTGSITEPGSYSGGTALGPTKEWRKNAARFKQLDKLAVRLIKLERDSRDE